MKDTFVTLIASLINVAIIGLIAWATYNAIAWNFNLAPLNYWTCTGAVLILRKIFQRANWYNPEKKD